MTKKEITTITVSRATMNYLNSLKGALEYMSFKKVTHDDAILLMAFFTDFMIGLQLGLINAEDLAKGNLQNIKDYLRSRIYQIHEDEQEAEEFFNNMWNGFEKGNLISK